MRTLLLALGLVLALAAAGQANETAPSRPLGLIDHARSHFTANCLPCHQGPKPLPYPPGPPAPTFSERDPADPWPRRSGSRLSPDELRAVRQWLRGKAL
jgi:nitrous oxide reductase accessory protein NosL